ncbi:MAG: hypothetical protein ABI771_06700 [Betaproteobacteria bacterium]
MPDLIELRNEGLFCPHGAFYIDPWRPVQRAVTSVSRPTEASHAT